MALRGIALIRPINVLIPLSIAFLVLVVSSLVVAECPHCYYDYVPMAGHGPAPDGSGRRLIQIKIDSSWGTQTNAAIWNGANDAANAWNNARDANGNTTGYYLQVQQDAAEPDYIIQLGTPPEGSCASVNTVG